MQQTETGDVATVIVDWVQRTFEGEVEVWHVQSAVKVIDTYEACAAAIKRAEDFLIQVGGDDLDAALDAAVAARDWQAAELLDVPIQAETQRKAP